MLGRDEHGFIRGGFMARPLFFSGSLILGGLFCMEKLENDIFTSPFNSLYWSLAAKEMKSVRNLCLIALIVALRIICQGTSIPIVKGYLEIQFDFIPAMVGGIMFGPIVAIISGFIADNVGFLINPGSAYNPCYTISAILSGLIYALFLYRQRITIWRIFVSKFLVNAFVNTFLGTLWIYLFYNTKGKGFWILMSTRALKNTIALPIECMVMILLIGLLLPYFKAKNLVSKEMPDKLKWI